jgi:hypothetical protein
MSRRLGFLDAVERVVFGGPQVADIRMADGEDGQRLTLGTASGSPEAPPPLFSLPKKAKMPGPMPKVPPQGTA